MGAITISVQFFKTGVVSTSKDSVNRNLCLDTLKDVNTTHTTYNVCDFNLSESLIEGQQYTISAKVNTSSHKKSVGFYLSGGSMNLGSWQAVTESGIYKVTFTATSAHASNTAGAGHGYIRVYSSNNTSIQGSTTVTGTANVGWLKLEEGNTATHWCANSADSKQMLIIDYLTDENGTILTDENGEELGYSVTDTNWHGFVEGYNAMSIFHDHIMMNEIIEW